MKRFATVVAISASFLLGGAVSAVAQDEHREREEVRKEERHRAEIQQGDALVVRGEQPRADAVGGVEIVLVRHFVARQWSCQRVAHDLFIPRGRRNPGTLRGNR